ncbi:MAG: sigma-70 family RNA polymerase sigma factor [bacterium]|nr:sigma-70 family RNA polymerase sigma factor [bacterium]
MAAKIKPKRKRIPRTKPLGILSLFLRDISRIPLLSDKEIRKLSRLARAGNKGAQMKLVEHNLRFVVSRSRNGKDLDQFLDNIQEGSIGAMRGMRAFDPRKGKITTYMNWWIRQGIGRAQPEIEESLPIPHSAYDKLQKLRMIVYELQGQKGRIPSLDEIESATLGRYPEIKRKHIVLLMPLIKRPRSMESLMRGDTEEDGGRMTPRCRYSFPSGGLTPEQVLMAEEEYELACQELLKFISSIREIIVNPEGRLDFESRYGFDDSLVCRTYDEVRKRTGVTREAVRQRILKVWRRMGKNTVREGEAWLSDKLEKIRDLEMLTGHTFELKG